MTRFDGTAVRQLVLIDDQDAPAPTVRRDTGARAKPPLRLLQQDLYQELARRRRRAQIAARHLLTEDDSFRA